MQSAAAPTHHKSGTGKGHLLEKVMKLLFLIAACFSIIAVLLICFFLFANGIPAMGEIGLFKFLSGVNWKPGNNIYGILPMILGSIYVTAGALVIGVPIGLLTAVFLARFCPKGIYRIVKPAVSLMAGIPSVVYGFFGMCVIVPMIRPLAEKFQGDSYSMLTASILLGLMILPTIVEVTESSLRAVPESYYEASLALGATHERSVYCAVFPAAKSGIMAGIVLGVGRAIGETMAVIMIAGNQPRVPDSIFDGVRTLTANIVIEMGYASGLHRQALIATGVVLFVFILILNVCFSLLKHRSEKQS
ncbi:MAG TPA: phosphate ABC transporter permease subunit PstC [Candidatus Faecivivens stercoripullorum]|uniref:Phosphate transport system permease protein n=1 Tax=Candidatus Faecivivens stercoripullorum TaxID=2840805 RepID=A0A9D1H7C2_9FIRM|nr:phosphate ABC transporter permease subunit PstC [Candidatus Faecivivens stercoripullorum]